MKEIGCLLLILLPGMVLPAQSALAGEIAGLPPSLPPTFERRLELSFSNDFLGRGGATDDFRTQQLILAGSFASRWTFVIDHSILTLEDAPNLGRSDQLSASLGYRLIDDRHGDVHNRLIAGLGLRSQGNFAGERIQNGFHRLVGSGLEFLPYTDSESTDVTAWVDAHRYVLVNGTDRRWRLGYWLRASSLVTSDGQWDGAAGLYAVAARGAMDAWLGFRRDWRSGYDTAVLRETAQAEDDLALALGFRWGSLVLETVQQFNNDASYGQLRLVANEDEAPPAGFVPRFGFSLGFLLPDVQLQATGRYPFGNKDLRPSTWSRAVLVTATYGEPQFDDETTAYLRSSQLGLGLEWERLLDERRDWLALYTSLGAGWRREQLLGAGNRAGLRSASADRAVLLAGLGLRVHAATLGERWKYRLQFGVEGWLPASSVTLNLDADGYDAQQPGLAFLLGVSFDAG